ncbi:MAG: phage integrase N-terminal SAM-like domain-containing protein [Candidatus Subteraquimicrobiales bacterium]|nr:phage integrase N-terminal SAM-like domain-containing protein [Candidatus Subteraquimicrobiales bacterium]
MFNIPNHILSQYEAILKKKVLAVSQHADYKKWLRYYLDFCSKHPALESKSDRVRSFIEKLKEKKQTPEQQKQAAYAVSLYFEILRNLENKTPPASVNSNTTLSPVSEPQPPKRVPEAEYAEKPGSPEWDAVIAILAAEIKTRHYSRKTLKAYARWSRQFQKGRFKFKVHHMS